MFAMSSGTHLIGGACLFYNGTDIPPMESQSDIKKLKKENEQLRREIWTLRDEYDKLERILASKVNLDCDDETNDTESCHSHGSNESCNSCGSCSNTTNNEAGANSTTNSAANSCNVSEESQRSPQEERFQGEGGGAEAASANSLFLASSTPSRRHHHRHQCGSGSGSSKQVPESPLSDLQSVMPPLKHFESIQYENIGPGNVDENGFIIKNASASTEDILAAGGGGGSSTSSSQQQQPTKWTSATNKPDILLQQSTSQTPVDPVSSFRTFQTGGNLDELLQDIELLSKDIEELQVQNKNRSETSLDCEGATAVSAPNSCKKKPFKSEVSLFLEYPDNNLSRHEIETHPTIHPVPSDEKMLPSPPAIPKDKQHQRSSTAFELHTTTQPPPPHLNGSATVTEHLNKSQTFEMAQTDKKTLSASETALAAAARSKSKRVSLSLTGKKTKVKRGQEPPLQNRRMSLSLDLDIPIHRITRQEEQTRPTPVTTTVESRRHSYDSNKSQSHHHKKRSRSDSINSRGTYSEQTSQRRLSITSYQTKSKIPWCGCWGLC